MTDIDSLRALMADGPRRIACPDEPAYLAAWQAHALPWADALLPMAVAAGRIADRLAWVFQAGYQAACRDAFPDVRSSGWIAYAASEDRKNDPPLPGVTLADGCLNGFKTWVAGARSLEQLAIKLGSGPDAHYLLIPRDTPGLTVLPGHTRRFLSEMSQGQAHFDRTPLAATTALDPRRIRHFGLVEPLYVYAAFCGFVLGSTDEPDLVACARDCLAAIAPALQSVGGTLDHPHLGQADARAQDLLARLSDNRLQAAGNWLSDQRLISMYSGNVQRHVQGH